MSCCVAILFVGVAPVGADFPFDRFPLDRFTNANALCIKSGSIGINITHNTGHGAVLFLLLLKNAIAFFIPYQKSAIARIKDYR